MQTSNLRTANKSLSGIMHYQEFAPHAALREYIACYFSLRVNDAADLAELVIPDGTSGLMFVQHARFTRLCPARAGERHQLGGSYVFGQKTRPVHYVFNLPGLHCFGLKFQPHGLKAFTRIPAHELTDTFAEAGQVLGNDVGALEDRLFFAASAPDQKTLLDEYFTRRLACGIEPDHRLVQQILDCIHRHRGQVAVADLLQTFLMPYKRLERLFRKFVGLRPKAYCCITRFNATLLHRERRMQDSLTQLAYASGYFDQMHFIREVKQFTHLTPKEFYKTGIGEIGAHQRLLLAERMA